MKQAEAQRHMKRYLKAHNLRHVMDFDNGAPRISILYTNCALCPDRELEGCIWFYNGSMEARTYFNQRAAEFCRSSSHTPELLRLLNFINARVWPSTSDGMGNSLYWPSLLYTPRLYLTEDGCQDITLTALIPYDFYELAPLETEDFITACCPDLLNHLSPAIFGVLQGRLGAEQAIRYISKTILYE